MNKPHVDDEYTWELVYSVNFFKTISNNIVDKLEKYYIDNKVNPYSKYEFGTYWIKKLNFDSGFEKYVAKNIEKNKKVLFKMKMDALIEMTKSKLTMNYKSFRLAVIAALFFKASKTYKACNALLKEGFAEDSEALTRILFEEMLKIGYCSIGENECNQFLDSDIKQSIKALNAIISNPKEVPEEFFETIGNYSLEELKKEKVSLLTKPDANEISIEAMVKRIDKENQDKNYTMIKLYNVYYRSVCNVVHTNPNAITSYLIFKDNKSIDLNPNFEANKCHPEMTSIEFMLMILNFISKVFGFPTNEEIEHLNSIKTNSF